MMCVVLSCMYKQHKWLRAFDQETMILVDTLAYTWIILLSYFL